MIEGLVPAVRSLIKPLVWFVLTVCCMTTTYWCLVRFMAAYCAPDGVYGLVTVVFTAGSPLCQAFVQILARMSDFYLVLWASAVTGFVGWFAAVLGVGTKGSS